MCSYIAKPFVFEWLFLANATICGGNMQINPDAPVKEYTGVWIPADVMESEELSPMEKILYGEIAGFRECYASNAWLASRIGRTERTVKRLISHLIELGFIEKCGFNGRFRLIRVCQNCHLSRVKNDTPAVSKMTPINKSIDKSINDNKLSEGKPSEYGNKDVNELLRYWKERTNIEPSNNKANRNACSTLIKQRGLEGAKKTVDLIAKAMTEQFAPKVSSFSELYGAYGKLSKLDAFAIRLEAKNPSERILKRFGGNSTNDTTEISDEERKRTSELMKEARKKLFN